MKPFSWFFLFILIFTLFAQQPAFVPAGNYPLEGDVTCVKPALLVNQPNGIAALSLNENMITFFGNDGNGSFQVLEQISFGFSPLDMVLAFVDGSNVPQYVIVGQTADTNGIAPDSLLVLKHYLPGQYEQYHLEQVRFPIKVAKVNLNNDNIDDIAVANYEANGTITSFLGNDRTGLSFADEIPVGEYPVDLIGLDINHNENEDLIVLNWRSKNIHILSGTGDGSFQPLDTIQLNYTPLAITRYQIPGVKYESFAVLGTNPDTVEVFGVTELGTVEHVSGFSLPALSSRLLAVDVNFDEYEDLVVAVKTMSRIDVYLNADGTNFVYHSSAETESFPQDIMTDDFDLDSRPDIATANYYGNSITTLFHSESPVSAEHEEDIHKVHHFELFQNYPNPFNPYTKISFKLDQPSSVTLTIFDISGKRISTLIDEELYDAGTHTKSFSGADLPSGIYLYKLEVGHQSKAGKMILMK